MQKRDKWGFPESDVELDFRGAIPEQLDGLLLAPEVRSPAGPVVHCIRLARGRPRGYRAVPLSEMSTALASSQRSRIAAATENWIGQMVLQRELAQGTNVQAMPAGRLCLPPSRTLVARREAADRVEWTTLDRAGGELAAGSFSLDPTAQLCDLAVTRGGHLVLVSRVDRSDESSANAPYRVGVATGATTARVSWLDRALSAAPSIVNVHDDGNSLTIDLACSHDVLATGAELLRVERELPSGSERWGTLFDGTVAWPTIHPEREGASYRYLYAIAANLPAQEGFCLLKLDVESRRALTRSFGFARRAGAPTIVSPSAQNEEQGYLLAPVYDAVRDSSELLVLDTMNIDGPSAPIIRLPASVRPDLPGVWWPA